MFGTSVVVIGDFLYNYVSYPLRSDLLSDDGSSTDVLARRHALPVHAALYAIRLCGCACILVIFTGICLGFDRRRRVIPGEPRQQQAGKGFRIRERQNVVRECLWAVGLVTLVVLIALADWYLFLRNTFLAHVIWD